MTASARDVAAVIRERLPEVGRVKLHKLLYYCQSHHLATFNRPLFTELIFAWDMGPVVSALWREEKHGAPAAEREPGGAALGEAELNTVGYVLSRYGGLSGKDLENLSHSEVPWQIANSRRQPGGQVRIRDEWMRDYFLTDGAPRPADDDIPLDSETVSQWLADAEERRLRPARPDSPEEILARLRA
jgi:uncharacterized phage-associated protein